MQTTRRLQVLPGRVMALALGLVIVLMLAGSFGFWLRGLSLGHETSPTAFTPAAREQVTHNRDEEGLGGTASFGGQQIAHNRDEEGLQH